MTSKVYSGLGFDGSMKIFIWIHFKIEDKIVL